MSSIAKRALRALLLSALGAAAVVVLGTADISVVPADAAPPGAQTPTAAHQGRDRPPGDDDPDIRKMSAFIQALTCQSLSLEGRPLPDSCADRVTHHEVAVPLEDLIATQPPKDTP